MDSIEEFDIRESFEAMDDDMLGEISFDAFCTLYLGLGYPKATKKELRQLLIDTQGDASRVTLETVFSLLSKKSRDRPGEISKSFSLIDTEGKGSIVARDIKRFAEKAGDSISMEVAKAVMQQITSEEKISESSFSKLMAPRSP